MTDARTLPYRKENEHRFVIVAIGANLPAANGCLPLQNCELALRCIVETPSVYNVVRSRWYSSAPVPPSSQQRYINAVAAFNTGLTAPALLAALQAIEAKAGRIRAEVNAARVLDLDIIDMGGEVRRAPDPVLPHPRAHLRAFVLLPLRDVAPRWVHPLLGLSVQGLLDALPAQDAAPLQAGQFALAQSKGWH